MDGNGDFQPFFHGNDLENHPIETTIYKWMASRFQEVYVENEMLFIQENYHTPSHTPISHTRSAIPRSPTMKGIPL